MFAGDAAEASSPMAQEAEQEAEADAETEAPIQPQEADEQAEEAAVPEKFDAARSQLKTQLDMSMLRTTTSRQSAEAARSVLRSMITEEGEAQPQDGAQEAAPEADEVRASAPVGLPGVTNNSPPHQKQKTEHKHKKTVADGSRSLVYQAAAEAPTEAEQEVTPAVLAPVPASSSNTTISPKPVIAKKRARRTHATGYAPPSPPQTRSVALTGLGV